MADTMVLPPCSGLYVGKKRVAVGARQRYAGDGALGSLGVGGWPRTGRGTRSIHRWPTGEIARTCARTKKGGSPPRPQPGRLPLPDPQPGGSTRPSPAPARNGRSWDRVYDALRAWRAQQGIKADMPIRGRRMNPQSTTRHGIRRAMPSSHRPAGERPPYIRVAPSRQAENSAALRGAGLGLAAGSV